MLHSGEQGLRPTRICFLDLSHITSLHTRTEACTLAALCRSLSTLVCIPSRSRTRTEASTLAALCRAFSTLVLSLLTSGIRGEYATTSATHSSFRLVRRGRASERVSDKSAETVYSVKIRRRYRRPRAIPATNHESRARIANTESLNATACRNTEASLAFALYAPPTDLFPAAYRNRVPVTGAVTQESCISIRVHSVLRLNKAFCYFYLLQSASVHFTNPDSDERIHPWLHYQPTRGVRLLHWRPNRSRHEIEQRKPEYRARMSSWVYKLAKNEIIEHLRKQNVDTEGTFEDLRQRLVQLAKRQPELFTDTENRNWVNGTVTENKDAMPERDDSATTIEPGESIAKIMGQIRKWGCHFDGRDPHSFLERVEELSQVYGYPGEYLLRGLPEMLRGEALTWFRNGRENWHSWEEFRSDFKAEYIPRESQVRMRRQARGREQKEGESFRSYANDLLKLMRRAGGWSAKEQLDLLYENMLPETKRFIRPDEVDSLGELRTRVTEVEQIEQQIRERKQKKPESQNLQSKIPPAATMSYNKDECCWRCKQRGHSRFDCKRPPRKFCSQCGKDDVLTRECHPRPGNGQRAEYQKETRPSKIQ